MEKKLESLKRLVEESSLERIEEIYRKGPQICQELHLEFDKTTQEVFELENEEQKLAKETKELEKQIEELKTEKKLIKQDAAGFKTKEYQKDIEIRRANRERDDESQKLGNLPVDSSNFDKWEKKTAEVDRELEKYLAIFLDIARNSYFDEGGLENLKEFPGEAKEKVTKDIFSGKILPGQSLESTTNLIEKIENWVNMFVIIQKRNLMGEEENLGSEQSRKKSQKNQRRYSRRMSKRHSFRKSVLSNQSLRKVNGLPE